MTTIITRLFPDQAAAKRASDRLTFKGLPTGSCTVIVAGEKADGQMARARVHESAVAHYAKQLDAGNAVLAVRADYRPLGAARIVREYLNTLETIDTGKVTDDFRIAWEPDNAGSILKGHPHMLSLPGKVQHGPITGTFGMNMLKKHRSKRPLIAHDRRMSQMFWPTKLLSTKSRASKVIHGGRVMSKTIWPMPLLSKGERRNSTIPNGAFQLSRLFGFRTTT